MNDSPSIRDAELRDLVARFGALRVFIALLRALRPAAPVGELPDYLRRDVGLPPRPPDPRTWERYR